MGDSGKRATISPATEALLVGGMVALVTSYWTIFSLLIHRSFHSNGWDLGLINQVVWNSANGRFFEYSFRDISYAGDHWQPFLLVLVPLKWGHTGPEALLVIQAVALAAAAVPLYASARATGGYRVALALAVAYLLGLGAARAISSDFHVEAFAPLFAFTALWGLERGRTWVFVGPALLILTLKEDGALLTLALCWIAVFAYNRRAMPAAVAGIALAYGVQATTVIIPHFRGPDLNPFVERYGYLGGSPASALWAMVAHPDRVITQFARPEALEATLIVVASAAFLPLLAPRLLPALIVVTVLPLLSNDPGQGSLGVHYLLVPTTVALLIGAVAVRERTWMALVRGAPFGRSGHSTALVGTVLVAVPLILLMLKSPLPPSFAAELGRFDVDEHARIARSFVRDVPDDVVVSAQSPFVPHLSERRGIYQFPRVLDAQFVLVDRAGPVPLDDLAAGYDDCLAALPRLGFDEIRSEDGISLWLKARRAVSVPDVPVACSGQHTEADPLR